MNCSLSLLLCVCVCVSQALCEKWFFYVDRVHEFFSFLKLGLIHQSKLGTTPRMPSLSYQTWSRYGIWYTYPKIKYLCVPSHTRFLSRSLITVHKFENENNYHPTRHTHTHISPLNVSPKIKIHKIRNTPGLCLHKWVCGQMKNK